jgi:ATP-dependent exoDNAse (exonuclease V) alpha subunit
VVTGMAGTGKSSLFRAAKDVWSAQERQVYGACLSGKAAQELSQASAIPAQTLHRLLSELTRGKISLDSHAVLLIDEAAMVGTRQMKTVFDHTLASGASLVLCGDVRQLQSIEAGGVFRELSERFGSAALKEIRRQRDDWARRAVRAFAEGRTAEALSEFADRGLLSFGDDAHAVMNQLLRDWKAESFAAPHRSIILASHNTDVRAFNELAQRALFRAGQLRGDPIHTEASSFFAGDRIVFTRNSGQLQVWNGQMATIEEVRADTITVQLDCGKTVLFSPAHYPHMQLGYALTTHKAQGLTVERAFVYLDPATQSRETAYVQASRARGLCSFYAVAESLEELVPSMTRSRPKFLATSLLKAPPNGPVLTLELAC